MVRRNAPRLPDAEAALGLELGTRRKRKKLPLKRLSALTDLSPSHLSRFLTGQRSAARLAAERIAEEVEMGPAEFIEISRRLPAAVTAALADPSMAYALMDVDFRLPASTTLVLRRASIGEMIVRVYPDPGRRDLPDPRRALTEHGYAVTLDAAAGAPRVIVDRMSLSVAGTGEAAVRFLQAHALGHLVLERKIDCDLRRPGGAEADATAFAAYFLIRQRRLEAELALARRYDLWREGGVGALVTDVAVRLQVPEWLLAFRLGDGNALGSAAGVGG